MPRFRIPHLLLTVAACAAALSAQPPTEVLSEADAVARALQADPSVQLLHISRAQDSLDLVTAESDWLPSLDASVKGSVDPLNNSYSVTPTASGSQAIPGGGTLTGALEPSFSGTSDSGWSTGGSYSVSVNQPLLRDAWRHSSPSYDIRLARLNEMVSRENFRKDLGEYITAVRKSYWELYRSSRLLEIAVNDLARAERTLEADRVRLKVGEAAEIDTLKSSLQVLRSRQTVLSKQFAVAEMRRVLAELIAVDNAQVAVPGSLAVEIGPPPAAEELLVRVRGYDPGRTVMELVKEKLSQQLARSRNALLPQLDASVSYTRPIADEPRIGESSAIALVLGYTIPTRKNRIAVEKARLSIADQDLELQQHDRSQQFAVQRLVESWSNDVQGLDVAHAAVAVARRLAEASQRGYDVGTIDQFQYLEDQESAVSEEVGLVEREVDMKLLEISIDELTGDVFSLFGVHIE